MNEPAPDILTPSRPSCAPAGASCPRRARTPRCAVEAEAVGRHRGAQRAHAAEARARPLEAALLQHAARGDVRDAAGSGERFEIRRGEGVVDHGAHGLRAVAAAPEGLAGPVADFRDRLVAPFVAANADEKRRPSFSKMAKATPLRLAGLPAIQLPRPPRGYGWGMEEVISATLRLLASAAIAAHRRASARAAAGVRFRERDQQVAGRRGAA
jgi:hypothetical protein